MSSYARRMHCGCTAASQILDPSCIFKFQLFTPPLIAGRFFLLYFKFTKEKGLDRILLPLKKNRGPILIELHFQIPSRAAVFSISLPLLVGDCQYVLFFATGRIQVYVQYDFGRSWVWRGDIHAVSEQTLVRIS